MKLSPCYYYLDKSCVAQPFQLPASKETLLWQPVYTLVQDIIGRHNITASNADGAEFIILFAKTRQLIRPDTLNNLLATNEDDEPDKLGKLRYIRIPQNKSHSLLQDKSDEYWLTKMRPIITIGLEDFSRLYAEPDTTEETIGTRKYLYKLHFDHRVKFWDSSIWHRYVPLSANFQMDFQSVLSQISNCWGNGLYSTYVALSSLESQTRIMWNSYICAIGDHGHGNIVTPFKFHSESEMKRKADELWDSLLKIGYGDDKLLNKINWSLLMVDDYATIELHNYYGNNAAGPEPAIISKKNLILNLLHSGVKDYTPLKGTQKTIANNLVFKITEPKIPTAEIRAQSRKSLSKSMYDVILLDYLLGEGKDKRVGREYGYDFMHDLQNPVYNSGGTPFRRGPLGRFWIFPISSFPFAFEDKLKQLGMDGQSAFWHLSHGGDPICTPEIFRFNFFNFIKQQIDETYLHPDALFALLNRFTAVTNSKLWRELVLNALQNVFLFQEVMLENDKNQDSSFARTMLSYLSKDEEYRTVIQNLKNYVTGLDRVPYFIIKGSLLKIKESSKTSSRYVNILRPLEEKLQIFYKPEWEFEKAMAGFKKKPLHKFEFTDKGLRWLPDNIDELKVTELHLSNNQLTTLPASITNMVQLTTLDLYNNDLALLPPEFSNLINLEYLDLRGNNKLPVQFRAIHRNAKSIQQVLASINPDQN